MFYLAWGLTSVHMGLSRDKQIKAQSCFPCKQNIYTTDVFPTWKPQWSHRHVTHISWLPVNGQAASYVNTAQTFHCPQKSFVPAEMKYLQVFFFFFFAGLGYMSINIFFSFHSGISNWTTFFWTKMVTVSWRTSACAKRAYLKARPPGPSAGPQITSLQRFDFTSA